MLSRRLVLPPSLAALAVFVLAACAEEGADAPVPVVPDVLAVEELQGYLPQAVDGLGRVEVTTDVQGALGAEVVRVTARYGAPAGEGRAVVLTVTDLVTAEMVEMMGYGWGVGAVPGTERIGGYPAQLEVTPAGADVRVLIADRFLVEAESSAGREVAEAAVRAVDLGALAVAASP